MLQHLIIPLSLATLVISVATLLSTLNHMRALHRHWWPPTPQLFLRLYGLPATAVWVSLIALGIAVALA